eukprot:TRINITY_DN3611_c0_g1_i1.p1 TRINITY_DN3611_c0_g1~~TRINITY_DN3611_c0_g1_i1.p1  ORF type:complete len:115 (-),score=52.40 TRINITY_DN3611_c0_g1_i1:59-403(-)
MKEWGGTSSSSFSWKEIADDAISLYSNKEMWLEAQNNGHRIVKNVFSREKNFLEFADVITKAEKEKNISRKRDFVGALLWQNQMRSTEFMSKWIELKNEKIKKEKPKEKKKDGR